MMQHACGLGSKKTVTEYGVRMMLRIRRMNVAADNQDAVIAVGKGK